MTEWCDPWVRDMVCGSCTCCKVPYPLHNAHPIAHPSEDGVLAIQPGRHSERDEKLRAQAGRS